MKVVFYYCIKCNKMFIKLLCIVCFSSLPYLFSLHGDFVFDDSEAIVKNKDVSTGYWTDSFSNDFWGTNISSNLSHKSYRPLTILSFKLNYLQSEQKLVAYHFKVTNLICHVICSILVWQVFITLFRTKGKQTFWLDQAFLSTLLFSVHPIHVEAVSGIVGRADILAGITFFLALLAYHKAANFLGKIKALYLILVVLLAGISMLCKENGVTVLGYCIIYELVTKFRIKVIKNEKDKSIPCLGLESLIRLSIMMVGALCLLYARWIVMGGTKPEFKSIDNPAAFANSTFTKLATFNYIYFLNSLLLVWPQWLCYDWSMGCIPLVGSINDYRIVAVMMMYLYGLLLFRAVVNTGNRRETKRQIILASALLVIPFLPASNIFFPVGFVLAERVLYLSSAGYCSLVVIGLSRMRRNKWLRKFASFFYCLLLLTFALRTWQRSLQWRTEYSLFTSGLSVCPLNAKVHYNVAKVADAKNNFAWALEEYRTAIRTKNSLLTSGLSVCPLNAKVHYNVAKVADAKNNFAWALEEYRTAIRLYPEYYQAMNNLANLLKNLKQYDEAEMYLTKAISLKQDFSAAWMNLGIVSANTKRYKESEGAYNMALKYRRNYPDCYYNLGNLHLEMNNSKAAVEAWSEAIKLSPKHNLAWTNILAHFDNTGQMQQALQIIPKALKELPNSASINFATANVYGKLERYEDAERHFLRAIEFFRNEVQAIHYANLGVLYHRWKKYSLAKKMYEKALIIDPQFKSASRNLNNLLKHFNNA